jgi:hypothetical protein
VARTLGLPLAPVVPARLCPLPGPLYTVLLGYKEAPVAEARLRFAAIVRMVLVSFLRARVNQLAAQAGGPFDVVSVVPSTHRPGPAPLARVEGLGAAAAALLGACWVPELLRRADTWAAGSGSSYSTTRTSVVPGRKAPLPRCISPGSGLW